MTHLTFMTAMYASMTVSFNKHFRYLLLICRRNKSLAAFYKIQTTN